MNIAFYIFSPPSYSAELTYVFSLISNFNAACNQRLVKPSFFIYVSISNYTRFNEYFLGCDNVIIKVSPFLSDNTIQSNICRIFRILTGLCIIESLYLLFEGMHLVSHNKLPFIFIKSYFWIPDMQMFELSKKFSFIQKAAQYRSYLLGLLISKKVIVSSYYQKNVCISYYPFMKYSNKFSVLRFTSRPSPFSPALPAKFSYLKSTKFFFLPNQWWSHKNHSLVISMLQSFDVTNIPLIVCTGSLIDYRTSASLSDMMSISNLLVLGQVDYSFVVWLYQNCIAVINPSFYEGWSSSVEEARLYCRPIILSNIPVHEEQDHPCSYFFNPSSVSSLYDAITNFLTDTYRYQLKSECSKAHKELNINLSRELTALYYYQ